MQNTEVIALIKDGVEPGKVQRWADLGCGGGTFTLALAYQSRRLAEYPSRFGGTMYSLLATK